jgi:glycosyltransferase involved in cell wall biosynthesis
MRPLRVLIDHQIFLMQTFGGVSRYFVETARALRQQERLIHANILAPYHRNAYLRESPQVRRGLHGPSFRGVGRLFPFNEAVTAAYNAVARPDIVHETYYHSRRRYLASQKVVTTVYDMIHELFPAQFGDSDVSRLKYDAVRKADHVVAISERTREDLIRIFDVPPDKVSTVHLGVATARLAARRPTATIGTRPYLLYVGNRDGYKNFSTLVEAIALSTIVAAETSLVCFGGPDLRQDELAHFRRLGLNTDNIVHLAGSDEILAWLYENAVMLVYPSRYEGFGIPPLEAMQRNCPVVCSNAGSLPEVVGQAALVFDPNDAHALARSMEYVITKPEVRDALIDKGRSRGQLFSWETCARRTAEIYRMVAAQ